MRKFSNNVKLLMSQDEVIIDYLVKIDLPSSSILDTTAAYDVTIPSIGTFSAGTGLLIVEAPRLSSAVDREIYKITYIDPEFNKRSLFEAGLTGSKLTSYVCFVNTTNYVLGGAAPGQILTNPEDLIIAYKGNIDTQGYSVDPSQGTAIAVIEGASPMASLGMTRAFRTSKEEMSHVNPNDTAFDQVSVNSSKVTYLWGKA